jgi:hypothetical protein
MKVKNNNFIVYIHIRPDTNEPFYVGEGRPQRRNNKRGRNQYWWNIVNKNRGVFESKILFDGLTKEQSLLKEKEVSLDLLNKGYILTNIAECGIIGGMTNRVHTLESIEKMKKSKHTPESREKIRQSRLGKKDSLSTFNKKSKIHKGKSCSELTKQKISQANKGRKITWNLKGIKKDGSKRYIPILQYDLQDNFIKEWSSIKEATLYFNSEKYNSTRVSISLCCKGKYKTAIGFKWKYKNGKK